MRPPLEMKDLTASVDKNFVNVLGELRESFELEGKANG